MGDEKPKPAMDKPAEKMKPEGEENSGEDIKSVVAEHGPAHHVEIHHDKATNKHHVHSKHGEEEHEHHSVHDSAEEAHEHAGEAMGTNSDEPEDEEMGEEAGEEMPAMEEGSRNRIPGL
jgi:hypothetical protein